MNLYPTLAVHNSQAANQCNSTIKPLASMVSYMEYQNFLLFSKLCIWYRNMLHMVFGVILIEKYPTKMTSLTSAKCYDSYYCT